jgi:hypothetical protein
VLAGARLGPERGFWEASLAGLKASCSRDQSEAHNRSKWMKNLLGPGSREWWRIVLDKRSWVV